MKLGLFLLMPMLLVGGGLMIAAYPLLGMIILFGGDVLFLTVTLLMIAFKKQIVAGKNDAWGLTKSSNKRSSTAKDSCIYLQNTTGANPNVSRTRVMTLGIAPVENLCMDFAFYTVNSNSRTVMVWPLERRQV